MSTQISKFKKTLRQRLPFLAEEYHVDSLGFFGSYVREEQGPDSDLDVIVTFHQPPGLLKFVELEDYLTETLGVKVDLVVKDALRKRIGARILSEVVPL
ncbi:MAG: nucleotidyltransferase family protein [bacterium]|nr:nucleotidyltransferase family protein [bacterium]